MNQRASLGDWRRIARYYASGIINTLFSYGLLVVFLALGVNIYVAQLLGQVVGMAFNYFTFSRIAFADRIGSRARFILSYAVNYLLGLATLTALLRFITSPYLAGLATILIVSAINYLLLARIVFARAKPA